MKSFLKATKFAAEKHSTQRRKDPARTPYINHPIEVAEQLARVGGISDEAILIAAILHDTVEDTPTTTEEIREHFGEEICGYVIECTDDKSLPKAERKRLQIVNAPHKSNAAKQIKIADKTCNLRSVLSNPPDFWDQQRRLEYYQWAAKVGDGLKGINPALDAEFFEILEKGLREFR